MPRANDLRAIREPEIRAGNIHVLVAHHPNGIEVQLLENTRRTAFSFCACRSRRNSPRFISLTNALPAANWQEREIQDMFGLKLEGHPNPRRCALHDDWPEVYPLRKDFDLHTVLPPFTGRAA